MRFPAVVLVLVFLPLTAFAQNARSAVSVNGLDSNACTPAQPCRSFATAIAHTNVGGEVIALDSAGFGTFTVTDSLIVEGAPGVYAGVTSNGTDAITINTSFSSTPITLRGLTINSVANVPDIAINMGNGNVQVYNCVINRASAGLKATSTSSRFAVFDTTMTNVNDGIRVVPALIGGTIRGFANNVTVTNFSGFAFGIEGNSRLTVTHSTAAMGFIGFLSQNGLPANQVGGQAELNLEWCVGTSNSTGAYVTNTGNGGVTYLRVSNSVFTNNSNYGMANGGNASSFLQTRLNNTVRGNESSETSGILTTISGN
jgi:hypothetical protein